MAGPGVLRGPGAIFLWTLSNVRRVSKGACTRWWSTVWPPACTASHSAAGEGAEAAVLGKEVRGAEQREEDWCLGPAGRRVAGKNIGEEGVGSGKLGSKDAV